MATNVGVSNGLTATSSSLGSVGESIYPPETLIAAALQYNRLGIEDGFEAFDQVLFANESATIERS